MAQNPGGGEAHGPRAHTLGHQATHGLEVLVRRRLVLPAPGSHDEVPHGAVGNQGSHIQGVNPSREVIEIFGIAGPSTPGHAFVEGRSRDVLYPFHEFNKVLFSPGGHGSKAHTAVTHDNSAHTLPGGGQHGVIPGHLPVEMGVNIDPSRGNQPPLRINLFPALTVKGPHSGDQAILKGKIPRLRCGARAVQQDCVAQHAVETIHAHPLSSSIVQARGPSRAPYA